MSWTRRDSPYQAFVEQAASFPNEVAFPQWLLNIFEVSHEHPAGRWRVEANPRCLHSKATLRIVFAPLDLPRRDSLDQTLEAFSILGVPDDFARERVQSVSHSFGRNTDPTGSCSWFHFLCKNIDAKKDANHAPEVDNRSALRGYSWHRAGFFLRADSDGCVTLVCFGDTPQVSERLKEFIASNAWEHVLDHPYVLFDLVLEGLYYDIDDTLWKMNTIFGPLELSILEFASKRGHKMSSKIPFTAMHNCAKHIIHIAEALESCIMVVDSTIQHLQSDEPIPATDGHLDEVVEQLRERLQYRRSVLRSSQLRLASLQKRIDNAIVLSTNLVTQQDSMSMVQSTNSVKIMAAVMLIFLPIIGVTVIIGSQLFVTHRVKGSWETLVTPLFWTMLWISIPLTALVLICALSWHWWTRVDSPPGGGVVRAVKARAATLSTMTTRKSS